MNTTRRTFLLAGTSAAFLACGGSRLWAQAVGTAGTFTPEQFGAKGDGVTNDSRAFAALAAAVNANGGGIVSLRPVTYLVGRQFHVRLPGAGYAFEPDKLLEFRGCRKALQIRGNGAKIRSAAGLRYGTFDGRTGRPVRHAMPYLGGGVATPYRYMIKIEDCTGPVEVSDLELDGNLPSLQIGGQYGDTGWQIPAIGLALVNNRGAELVRNIYTHHHAQDGFYVDGVDEALRTLPQRRIVGLRSEYNGRQGCSIVGGRGYRFEKCRFAYTGRSAVASAPGAGVDIEAEGGKKNRDFVFTECEFFDNFGCGLVADTGDSEGVEFVRCSFIGTTNWSAWPNKPRFHFRDCSFVGAMTRAHGDVNPARAAQFYTCNFSDDPALAPGRKVYGGTNTDRPLADLSDAQNVLFSRCTFRATHNSVLPWSTGAIYADCTMKQAKKSHGFPRGKFVGRTVIEGIVDLYGSRIVGEVVINGRRFSNTSM